MSMGEEFSKTIEACRRRAEVELKRRAPWPLRWGSVTQVDHRHRGEDPFLLQQLKLLQAL